MSSCFCFDSIGSSKNVLGQFLRPENAAAWLRHTEPAMLCENSSPLAKRCAKREFYVQLLINMLFMSFRL